MYTFLSRRWQRRIRSGIATTAVLALVACSLGLPLPLQIEKSTDERYPCENCSCGCANAEMCWKNCCCHTREEKLAWAEKNGVTPPAYVKAATRERSCCESKPQIAKASGHKKSCCCSSVASCCDKNQQGHNAHNTRSLRTVVTLQVLKCQGLTSLVTSLPPIVISDHACDAVFQNIQVGTVSIDSNFYICPIDGPESPPPQSFS